VAEPWDVSVQQVGLLLMHVPLGGGGGGDVTVVGVGLSPNEKDRALHRKPHQQGTDTQITIFSSH